MRVWVRDGGYGDVCGQRRGEHVGRGHWHGGRAEQGAAEGEVLEGRVEVAVGGCGGCSGPALHTQHQQAVQGGAQAGPVQEGLHHPRHPPRDVWLGRRSHHQLPPVRPELAGRVRPPPGVRAQQGVQQRVLYIRYIHI